MHLPLDTGLRCTPAGFTVSGPLAGGRGVAMVAGICIGSVRNEGGGQGVKAPITAPPPPKYQNVFYELFQAPKHH